jgi:hypothetical protein
MSWVRLTKDVDMDELMYMLLQNIDVEEGQYFRLEGIVRVGKRRFAKIKFPYIFQYLGED